MSDSPKISVIMAEYNTPEENLKQAIQSILWQTYTDFEFIIVDDCGQNEVAKIAQAFQDTRIRILKNEKNRGLVFSLNKAVAAARGTYLVRMDTDDYSAKNRIEVLIKFIEENPQYAVVSSRMLEKENNLEIGILGKAGEKKAANIVSGDIPPHPAALIKKAALQAVGGYKDFPRAEDFALWCDLLLDHYRLYVLEDILYDYQVRTSDYEKRKLKNRKGELQARWYYNKQLKAGRAGYIRIFKSIVAGLLPVSLVKNYRKKRISRKQ